MACSYVKNRASLQSVEAVVGEGRGGRGEVRDGGERVVGKEEGP